MERRFFTDHICPLNWTERKTSSSFFCSYESRWKPEDAKPFERGMNALQLVNDGKRWWITAILWQGEDEKLALPRGW